jgi:DNA-binding CsgD family transcriptional regulator
MMQTKKSETHLPNVIAALGDCDFFSKLLSYLNISCHIDHLAVFIFDHQLVPQLIEAKGIKNNHLALKGGKIYTTRLFHRQDPNAIQIQQKLSDSSDISLLRMRAADIPNPEYKQLIYDQFKLIDRISLLAQTSHHWFVVNLYRDIPSGEFTKNDLTTIHARSGLIVELCRKHFILLPSSVWKAPSLPEPEMLQSIIHGLGIHLSPREIEVCSYALIGVTNEGIGLTLGIQPSTVATLRKRAFSKLKVSNINQLFGLCLGQVITSQSESS